MGNDRGQWIVFGRHDAVSVDHKEQPSFSMCVPNDVVNQAINRWMATDV